MGANRQNPLKKALTIEVHLIKYHFLCIQTFPFYNSFQTFQIKGLLFLEHTRYEFLTCEYIHFCFHQVGKPGDKGFIQMLNGPHGSKLLRFHFIGFSIIGASNHRDIGDNGFRMYPSAWKDPWNCSPLRTSAYRTYH